MVQQTGFLHGTEFYNVQNAYLGFTNFTNTQTSANHNKLKSLLEKNLP